MMSVNNKKFILITGGCRSGKSEYAEELIKQSDKKVTYVATAQIHDQEFEVRVKKHKERRPADWSTIEEPINIEEPILDLNSENNIVLLDNLTSWLTNMMYGNNIENWHWDEYREKEILKRVESFAQNIKKNKLNVIIVTDEVGYGIVPSYPEGRAFRDLIGKSNQIIAGNADKVYLVVAGIPLGIKE
jgi:adenosylcobinamide kinase/adenosylcobinamide-phosphate guanylyltransferase